MNSKTKNRKFIIHDGFTLIELLVVIAIIGVLMGLLFPALSAARHRGRITRARMEMKQVETAWISYRNDYRHLPPISIYQGTMNDNAVNIMRGDTVQSYNSRGIAYMEFPESVADDGGFKDPWGEVYQLRLATDDNPNYVQWAYKGNRRFTLYRPVAVWSIGHDENEHITSW